MADIKKQKYTSIIGITAQQPLKLCIEQEQEYLARLKRAKETAFTSEEKRLYQSWIEAAEQKIKQLTGRYMDENRSQRSDI